MPGIRIGNLTALSGHLPARAIFGVAVGLTAVVSPARLWNSSVPGHDGIRAGGQSLGATPWVNAVIGPGPLRSAPMSPSCRSALAILG